MLYVGFFDYNYECETFGPKRGSFTYFVEAENPDAAVDAFKKGIKKTTRKRGVLLYGEIVLKTFVELIKLPPEGAMAFREESNDDLKLRVTHLSPVSNNPPGLKAYEWFEDGKEPDENMKQYTIIPFLTIPVPKKMSQKVRNLSNTKDLEVKLCFPDYAVEYDF